MLAGRIHDAGLDGGLAVSEKPSFKQLIRRVRARDEQAAAELIRRYEPALRTAVRVRLTDPALRRLMDSSDICQSVLANFFVRAALGQFDIDNPEQLLKLLTAMARNKVINYALKHRAARRDLRRLETVDAEEKDVAASGPSPGSVVANQELIKAVYSRLSDDERRLADLRVQGWSWTEIAAEIGGNPDAVRVRFTRAINRATAELQLGD